jgi:hypothetical protein
MTFRQANGIPAASMSATKAQAEAVTSFAIPSILSPPTNGYLPERFHSKDTGRVAGDERPEEMGSVCRALAEPAHALDDITGQRAKFT